MSDPQHWFMGIDGGGTSTSAALLSSRDLSADWYPGRPGADNLTECSRSLSGPSNPLAVGHDAAESSIRTCFDDLLAYRNVRPDQITGICAGIAGGDRQQQRDWLERVLRSMAPHAQVIVDNDAMNVLWSVTDSGCGIALIAGTGSFALAVTPSGKRFRAGGWGYLLGDEGSGYWIGLQLLRKCCKLHEAGDRHHALIKALATHLDSRSVESITAWTYATARSRRSIAALAEEAIRMAADGNDLCHTILSEAGSHLWTLICSLLDRFDDNGVQIAGAGGILMNSEIIQRQICERLDVRHQLTLVRDPTLGALRRCIVEHSTSE